MTWFRGVGHHLLVDLREVRVRDGGGGLVGEVAQVDRAQTTGWRWADKGGEPFPCLGR